MRDLKASLAAVSRQHAEGCVKIVEDLRRYEQIIERTRPDVIVESGTFSGKSALWFARTAQCYVVTVDVTPCIDPETRIAAVNYPIWSITGDVTAPDTIDRVRRFIDDRTAALDRPAQVMVSLDSDHSATHVAAEIEAYGPMVTAGCYLVVEDGLLRWMPYEERRHYTGTPLDAIEALLAAEPDRWEVDVELEDLYPVTQHPSGWLRKLPV